MNAGKFNALALLILLILAIGQYVEPALTVSASYGFVEPEELVEYKETLMLANATELLIALNATSVSLTLSEARIVDLSEELETFYTQQFPNGTFYELELFLIKVNEELKLNLTRTDIKAFVNKFFSEVEKAKERLVKGFSQDMLIPATLVYIPAREESAPYLHGHSLLVCIMVDDVSPRIPWNPISEAILRHNMGMVMGYLKDKAPKEAEVSFSGRIYHTSVDSFIDVNTWPPNTSWIDEAAKSLGYNDVHDMARKLKGETGADNVVLVFVPHKSSLLYGGYALPAPYWGYGERACVCFFLINLFGIGIPNPFSIYVHEILHLFGAADEYPYDRPQPWNAYPPLGELWPNTSPGWPLRVCVMCDPILYWFSICKETRGQIGWNDYDGDGILDPIDPDPRTPNRPSEWVFDVPAHGIHEVDVEINLTDVIVVGYFAPLVHTLTYPPPYINFFVKDPSGNTIIQINEVLNYSFSFNISTTGVYSFIFENPTDTPILYMELRLLYLLASLTTVESEAYNANLTLLDERGSPLVGIPVSIGSEEGYSTVLLTNLNGALVLWLTKGNYRVQATYMNLTILIADLMIESSVSQTYVISMRELRACIEGYVRGEAGKPISGVNVIALSKIIAPLGKVSEAKTDEMGHYFMEIPPGEYVLVFSTVGYADTSTNVSLSLGEVKRVDISLKQAKADFSEEWSGVKFEVALITKEPWRVGDEASVEVWITVSEMGTNQRVQFRQFKLGLGGTSVEKTVPLNVETDVGGTLYSGNVSLRVLDGFEFMEPESSKSYSLELRLEGSFTDNLGITRSGLTTESTSVQIYTPPSPVSLSAELPVKVVVGEEFDVKVKIKNEGEYPVNNIKVELPLPLGTSAVGPVDWSKSILNPGEEAVATFRLKADLATTTTVSARLSYTTLWTYQVSEFSKTLGSVTLSKVVPLWLYAIAAVCAIMIIGIIAVLLRKRKKTPPKS
jgi:hypothetical protein